MKSPQMIESGRSLPPGVVMTNRIIWFGLVMGQVSFAGVIVFLQSQGSLHSSGAPVNLMVAIDAAMLVFGAIVGWALSRWLVNPQADDQTLVRQYGLANIIPMALLEGPSFFGLVIVFLSANWWPAGMIPAICIVLQLFRFPRSTV